MIAIKGPDCSCTGVYQPINLIPIDLFWIFVHLKTEIDRVLDVCAQFVIPVIALLQREPCRKTCPPA